MDDDNLYLRAVKVMLKPVVRFCLRHAIRIQQLTEIVKAVAIEAAAEILDASDQEPSISRLNIMTGIHRAEVARIFKYKDRKVRLEEHISFRVMSRWLHTKKYLTAEGKPRVLDVEGGGSTFFEMVREVSTELNPYTVLFELERTGLVERTARGVRMLTPIFSPKDIGEGFQLLGDDAADLYSAVQENLTENPSVPNLHIKTEYTNVPASQLEKVRGWFLREGSAFHSKARAYLSKFDRDLNPRLPGDEPGTRVAICSFSIVDAPKGKKK